MDTIFATDGGMHELVVSDATQYTTPLLLCWTAAQGLYFPDHLCLFLSQKPLPF